MTDLKDLKGIAGVYCLKNEINGKVYVGLSKDIARRLREHYNNSINDKHTHLYHAINKYSIDNFSVSILEIVDDINDLVKTERKWILELKSTDRDKGYNIQDGSEEGAYIHSEETKLKISEAKKGVPMTDKHRAATEHTFFKKGHKVSDDVKRKRSIAMKEAWANGVFDDMNRGTTKGYKTSEETKRKQSEAKKGKKWTDAQRKGRETSSTAKAIHQFNLNNIYIDTFEKVKHIEDATNKEYRTPGISKCCNGGSKYYKDFVFKYADNVTLVDTDKGKSFIYNDGSVPEVQVKTRKTRTTGSYRKTSVGKFKFAAKDSEDIV